MRIVLCGGGTGGHVYPLLAVRAAMSAVGSPTSEVRSPTSNFQLPTASIEFLFIGGDGIEKDLVARELVPYQSIHGGGLHGVGIAHAIPNTVRLLAGCVEAWRTLRRVKPDAILATGGFITVPVALGATLQRIPLVVYLPDIEPALSVRCLGWLARRVTATAEASRRFFDARKFIVTGYPVRRELLAMAAQSRASARDQFGIAAASRVVLVFGGSRGARSLNRAVIANAERLLAHTELIHISGAGEWDEVRTAHEQLPENLRARYHAFAYLHEHMGAALAAADLVVSRSGASALGEFPLFGLPSVLVPYPHAWRYQKVNADFLASHGAAVIVRDEDLRSELAPTVVRLLQDEATLRAMGDQARALAQPEAAEAIARVVKTLKR
ncbi:MAG: UDP-N-acetylglucosamine--N-acetylmuramyl-(pentapeptide) pyrophosphoryl-undecaprenol N-acetylglucosamine transferase [Chloroflexota bacterium]